MISRRFGNVNQRTIDILEIIRKNPGCSFDNIYDQLLIVSRAVGNITTHLQTLERGGLINACYAEDDPKRKVYAVALL